jgi:ribosomal protein S18 acetylase RimI-like enzyme
MQDCTIRLATQEDARAIKALRLRALTDHPDIFNMSAEDGDRPEADYAALIKGSCILGAFSNADQTLLGHAQLAFHTRAGAKNRHKCELWWVYVRPEFRGHGLAKTLTTLAMNLARKLDYEAILLTVAAHNQAAITLYEQLGFIRYGCEPDMRRLPDGRRIDEVMMQCVL